MNVNAGTLLATGLNASAATPLGSGVVTLNGGVLQLHNNGSTGTVSNSTITFGNNVVLNPSLTSATIDVNNNGAGTANTIVMGTLTDQPTTILNVTGGNNYKLEFTNSVINTGNPNTALTFNVGPGLTLILPGGFSVAPINTGTGTLSFSGNNSFSGNTTVTGIGGVSAQANSVSTPYGTGGVILTNGSTLQISTLANTLTLGSGPGSYTQGGATARYFSFVGGVPSLNATLANGLTPSAVVGGVGLSDANISNHAPGINNASGPQAANDIEVYSALLNIANGGSYSFGINADDQASVVVDGTVIHLRDNTGTNGGFNPGFITGSVALSAGEHQIVVRHQNGGGGSGVQLVYSGPDASNNLPTPGWQNIPLSTLYYNTSAASANNAFLNAAQINNALSVQANAAATIDLQGSEYNATFAGITLNGGSTLTINNTLGSGFVGSIGPTTIAGSGVTLNANTGTLNLIGGISDSGNGVTTTGNGTVVLGNSGGNFTGPLTITNGYVQITDPNALTTGTTTLANTAVSPVTLTAGALTNSSNVVTVASTAGLVPGQIVSGGNIPGGSYVLSVTSGTTFVISNFTGTTAAQTGQTFTAAAGNYSGTIDLNGTQNVNGNIILNGNGPLQKYTLSAALTNSSAAAASTSSSSSISIGSASGAVAPSIGGYGDITLNGTLQDGTAGLALNKVGPDILTLAGNNTFTGVVSIAAGGGLKLGNSAALGGVPSAQSTQGYGTTTTVSDTTTSGLAVGMVVSGTGIPFGDTIASIVPGTSFTLTTAPTAAGTGLTFAAPVVAASGSFIDLGGQSITTTRQLTLVGLGATGLANNNTLGALINTSSSPATYSGNISLSGGVGIGSSNFNNSTPGGDILLTGTIGPATGGVGINKVGLDTLTIQGNIISTTGGYNIQQGTFVLSGPNGAFTAGAPINISSGATVKLDNTLGNVAGGRLGAALNGAETFNGNFTIIGNSNAAGTTELLSTATNGKITFGNSGSVITLQPDSTSGGLRFDLTSGIALARNAGATSLFRGNNLGTVALATVAATTNTAGFGDGTQTNPGLVGDLYNLPATNRGIVPWALVDPTNGGNGTSFAGYTVANGFQALAATDYTNTITSNVPVVISSTTVNASPTVTVNTAGLFVGELISGTNIPAGSFITAIGSGNVTINQNASGGATSNLTYTLANNVQVNGSLSSGAGENLVNSLTVNSGNTVTVGSLSNINLLSGGLLALGNGTSTISGSGALTTSGNAELIIHTPNPNAGGTTTLNIAVPIAGTNGPMTKADGGLAILGARELYLGNTFVNGGSLQLNGGNGTIFVAPNVGQAPGATGFAANNEQLQLNLGGTLDLNGTTQVVGNLNSANPLPNTGGILTNTSSTTSTFQTILNGNQTFSGAINGNVNFIRSSGFVYTLESASSFSGSTTIQGGQTILQDLAALTNTSQINLNGGALAWNDTGVQAVSNRLPSTAPITFNTGAFTYSARNGTQGAISLGNATFNSGSSLITVTPNNGGATLTIGTGTGTSLTRSVGGTATFFSGGTNAGIGDNARVLLANQPVGLLGGWATAYQNDSFIGQSIQPGFAVNTSDGIANLNANLTLITTGNVPTGVNARENANVTLPGPTTLNSLSILNAAAVLSFNSPTDTLTLTSGGLLTGADANNKSIGQAPGTGNLTAGSGQPELFIHVGANTLTVNSTITDNGVSGGLNVVADPMAGAGALTLTAANSYLGTTYLNNINTTLNSTLGPAIPRNLVITGGVSATDSLNATTTFAANNQIATGATVTLKGGATLNLASFSNTIANLAFDNTSGDLNGVGGTIQTGIGNLTVSGAISETNNTNSFLVPQINGFLTLGSATPTISVAANPFIPAAVGLNIGAATTITAPASTPLSLTGGGVIGITGQSLFNNGIAVGAGTTLTFGQPAATTGLTATFASVANSQVNLAGTATLDTRGFNGVIGSLTGSGVVTNTISATNTAGTLTTGNTATLTTGADNVALAQFDGTFTNPFSQSLLNVTKIGTGTMLLTADNSNAGAISPNTGTLTVSGGTVLLNSGSAKIGFTNDAIQAGGALTLDDTTNAVNNRLGGQLLLVSPTVAQNSVRTLTMQGGTLNVLGNSGGSPVAVTEGVGQLNPANGGIINLTSGGTGGVTLAVTNVSGQAGQSSLRINASNLGVAAPGTAGDSNVTISGTYGFPGTQGGGTAGFPILSVRPDIIATDTASGVTGFVTNGTNGLRLLNPAGNEYVTTTGLLAANATLAAGNAFNLELNSTSAQQTLVTNTPVGSVTLLSGGGLSNGLGTSGGNYGGQGLITLNIGSAGILATSGNTGINVGSVVSNGITMDIHVVGATTTLALNTAITNTTQGVVKSDEGTLSINQQQYFTGNNGANGLTINGGKVVLNTGAANAILVSPTASVPTLQALYMNSASGTLDLNGQSQAFERISSVNPLPGQGGTITSAGAANLFTVNSSAVNTTYSGSIGGAISLYKEGFGNPSGGFTTLTSSNGYTGSTNVLGGTLALRDSGSLTGTSAINVNYAQLMIDNTGLSDSTTRISSTVPINLTGGTINVAARQAVETQNIGTVTLNQGLNQFVMAQYSNNAQTGSYSLQVGNLVQQNNSALVFTNGTGVTIGQAGGNPHVLLTQLNGQNPVTVTTANNGILGGWAIADNGLDFAGYTAAAGVGGLSTTGFPAYSGNALTAGGVTDNISVGGTVQSVTSRTINSLAVRAPNAATTVAMFDQSQVLNIGTGGLLINDSGNKGVTIQGGQITAGGAVASPAALYVYANANTSTINSQIVNNGANALSLVRSGNGTITLAPEVIDTVASITANSNTLTVNNSQGLFVGMGVTGTGIPANEFITGITGNVITLTTGTGVVAGTNIQTTFAPILLGATSSTTVNSNQVTLATLPTNVTPSNLVGLAIGGPTIPGGAVIQSVVSGNTVQISQPALSTSTTAVITVGAESNTYSGPTITNGGSSLFGALNVNPLPGGVAIPGDLTVGNTTVTVNTQGGIASTSNITVNSGGTLTFAAAGTNTVNSVTFNSNGSSGGSGNIQTGALLNISSAVGNVNAITATNLDLGHTPTIGGTALALTNPTPTIFVSGNSLSPDGLLISAPITIAGGQIQKTGGGSLILTGASTFANGFNIQAGSIIFGASSTGTVTSGPAGTGTLVLNGTTNSTILSSANNTIANAVTVNGGFTFGGNLAVNGLTLSGPVALGAGANSINVAAPTVTSAISGIITGGTNLSKTGPGILTLSNGANTYGGSTIVSAGVLKSGNATPFPLLSQVQVNQGAEFDINATTTTIASLIGDSATTGGLVTDSGAAATLNVGADNLLTPSFGGVLINGLNALTLAKVGTGNQTLTGQNLFTGGVNVTDGQLTITNSNALGNTAKIVNITNNSGYGTGSLHLNPGAGPAIALPAVISFQTSNSAAALGAVVNDNGNNTINGNFNVTSGGGSSSLGSTSGVLTLNGIISPGATARFLSFRGNGNIAVTATGAFADTAANQLGLIRDYGTGTLTISGASTNGLNAGSTFADNNGTVLFNGAGKAAFTSYTVQGGATLALDNSGTNTVNRLGNKPLNLNGGLFTLNGNATPATAASETVSTLTFGTGGSTVAIAGAAGQGTSLIATSLVAPVSGGTALVTGDNLASATGPGISTFNATTFNVQAGQTVVGAAGDANGQVTKAIRADILADGTGGLGAGFLTKDSVTGNLRPLSSTGGELASTLSNSLTTNFGNFASTQTYASSLGVNSLAFLNGGLRIQSAGGGQTAQTVSASTVVQEYTSAATLNTITVNTGGVMATTTGSVNVGALTTTGNTPFIFQVTGASPSANVFDVTGYLTNNTGGLTKAGGGTLRLDSPEFYSGVTTANAGTLALNSGAANTISVTPTATTPILQNLQLNGGTLDLGGQNQAVGSITSNDYVPGTGGNVTSASAASLISATNTSSTYSGVISGPISFFKAGTGTLTLTTPQTYTGNSNV